MILEYNYDKGNFILELFKKAELATLDIKTIKERRPDGETKFVMEYTLVEDYAEPRRNLIREVLSESLPERLQIAAVLNQFIENQIQNNVNDFSLKFNAVKVRKCEISYSSSYKQVQPQKVDLLKELISCLERYDHIINEMGISNQVTGNIYRREGSGRNKKYVSLTIKDVGNILRQSLMEE